MRSILMAYACLISMMTPIAMLAIGFAYTYELFS